jgi:hypothetical protein
LHHYSQQPRSGNNSDVYDKEENWHILTKRNIIQLKKKKKPGTSGSHCHINYVTM